MVAVRRVIEEEIDDTDIGTFLIEQSKVVRAQGCNIIPREGEPPFDPVPVKKGDLLHLRPDEYQRLGVYPNSPVYVMSVVAEANVFWALFLRAEEHAIGGQFFNGTQVSPTSAQPKRGSPRLAAEGGRHGA